MARMTYEDQEYLPFLANTKNSFGIMEKEVNLLF